MSLQAHASARSFCTLRGVLRPTSLTAMHLQSIHPVVAKVLKRLGLCFTAPLGGGGGERTRRFWSFRNLSLHREIYSHLPPLETN
jgi:hypothetical protein